MKTSNEILTAPLHVTTLEGFNKCQRSFYFKKVEERKVTWSGRFMEMGTIFQLSRQDKQLAMMMAENSKFDINDFQKLKAMIESTSKFENREGVYEIKFNHKELDINITGSADLVYYNKEEDTWDIVDFKSASKKWEMDDLKMYSQWYLYPALLAHNLGLKDTQKIRFIYEIYVKKKSKITPQALVVDLIAKDAKERLTADLKKFKEHVSFSDYQCRSACQCKRDSHYFQCPFKTFCNNHEQ